MFTTFTLIQSVKNVLPRKYTRAYANIKNTRNAVSKKNYKARINDYLFRLNENIKLRCHCVPFYLLVTKVIMADYKAENANVLINYL